MASASLLGDQQASLFADAGVDAASAKRYEEAVPAVRCDAKLRLVGKIEVKATFFEVLTRL